MLLLKKKIKEIELKKNILKFNIEDQFIDKYDRLIF